MQHLVIGAINGALTSLGLSFFDKLKKNKLEKRIKSNQAAPEDYFKLQIILSSSESNFEESNTIMNLFRRQYPMHTFPYSTLGGNMITQIIIDKQSKIPSIIATHSEYINSKELIDEGFRIMKSGNGVWKPKHDDELVKVFIPKTAQLYYLKGLTLYINGEMEEAHKLRDYAYEFDKTIASYQIY